MGRRPALRLPFYSRGIALPEGGGRLVGELVEGFSESIQALVAGGDAIGLEMIQADGLHERI
jgi:hypothetical protein